MSLHCGPEPPVPVQSHSHPRQGTLQAVQVTKLITVGLLNCVTALKYNTHHRKQELGTTEINVSIQE